VGQAKKFNVRRGWAAERPIDQLW